MSTWKRIAMAVVVSVSIAGLSVAQSPKAGEDKKAKSGDLNNYECKDVMRASGADRDIGLALLHGYFIGKKGVTTYSSEKMAEATDKFIEYCLDNPKTKAIEAMRQFVE